MIRAMSFRYSLIKGSKYVYSLSLSPSPPLFVSLLSLTLPHVCSKLRSFPKGYKVAAAATTHASSLVPIQSERVSAAPWKTQQVLMTSSDSHAHL